MKTPLRSRSSRNSGFTLVELLVVIGIIAILASVISIAAGSVIAQAKRAKATATASQIQTAAMNYYTEYGVYPADPSASGADYSIDDSSGSNQNWGNLICALSGNINPATGKAVTNDPITNTRAIAWLSMKSNEVDKTTGAPLNPVPAGTTSALYFNIAMDNDYDGVMGVAPSALTGKMPNFADSTKSNSTKIDLNSGSTTSGVAVWANCTGVTASTSNNANFWVHTY